MSIVTTSSQPMAKQLRNERPIAWLIELRDTITMAPRKTSGHQLSAKMLQQMVQDAYQYDAAPETKIKCGR
jgi:hypothetical protein